MFERAFALKVFTFIC